MPVSLVVGKIQTGEFEAGLDTNYRLLIASERGMEFRRLECLLGLRATECVGTSSRIDIGWSVLSGGRVVAAGSSREHWGGFYSDVIAREIGTFAARKGERYSVVLDIRRDGGDLNGTHPKLLVETHPGAWKDALVGYSLTSQLRTPAIATFAIAGLLTLVLPSVFAWLSGWIIRRTYTTRR